MNHYHKSLLVVFSSLVIVTVLIYSCKKEDAITDITARETYVNLTGYDMKITRYMQNQPAKVFDIQNEDTLWLETSKDVGADSTESLFRADSAVVLFADNKTYYMTDTTTSTRNFLKVRHTISPNGKIHYYRYTFTADDYDLAQ